MVPATRRHDVAMDLLMFKSPHLLHLTAISNISLHCICLVLPLTRTLELLQVRCIACITSTVANPMAKKEKKEMVSGVIVE